jgi:hypothetical protein
VPARIFVLDGRAIFADGLHPHVPVARRARSAYRLVDAWLAFASTNRIDTPTSTHSARRFRTKRLARWRS